MLTQHEVHFHLMRSCHPAWFTLLVLLCFPAGTDPLPLVVNVLKLTLFNTLAVGLVQFMLALSESDFKMFEFLLRST